MSALSDLFEHLYLAVVRAGGSYGGGTGYSGSPNVGKGGGGEGEEAKEAHHGTGGGANGQETGDTAKLYAETAHCSPEEEDASRDGSKCTPLDARSGSQAAGASVQVPSSSSGEGRGYGKGAVLGEEGSQGPAESGGEEGEEEEEEEDEVGSLSWRLQTLERELDLDEDLVLQEDHLAGFEPETDAGGETGGVRSGEAEGL